LGLAGRRYTATSGSRKGRRPHLPRPLLA